MSGRKTRQGIAGLRLLTCVSVLSALAGCAFVHHERQPIPLPHRFDFSVFVHPGFIGERSFTIQETKGRVTLDDDPLSVSDARQFRDLRRLIVTSPEWRFGAASPPPTGLPWNGPPSEFWDIQCGDAGMRIPRGRLPSSWRSRMMQIHGYHGHQTWIGVKGRLQPLAEGRTEPRKCAAVHLCASSTTPQSFPKGSPSIDMGKTSLSEQTHGRNGRYLYREAVALSHVLKPRQMMGHREMCLRDADGNSLRLLHVKR